MMKKMEINAKTSEEYLLDESYLINDFNKIAKSRFDQSL